MSVCIYVTQFRFGLLCMCVLFLFARMVPQALEYPANSKLQQKKKKGMLYKGKMQLYPKAIL